MILSDSIDRKMGKNSNNKEGENRKAESHQVSDSDNSQ